MSFVRRLEAAVTKLAICTFVFSTARPTPSPPVAARRASYDDSVCPAGRFRHIACAKNSGVRPARRTRWFASLGPFDQYFLASTSQVRTECLAKGRNSRGRAGCKSRCVCGDKGCKGIVDWLQCCNIIAELCLLPCCQGQWRVLHSCAQKLLSDFQKLAIQMPTEGSELSHPLRPE